jgi:hypothetical protein
VSEPGRGSQVPLYSRSRFRSKISVTPRPLAGMIADVRHNRDRLNSTGEKQGERVASGVWFYSNYQTSSMSFPV